MVVHFHGNGRAPDPAGGDGSALRTIWGFARDGWGRAPDPLGEVGDHDAMHRDAGYACLGTLGHRDSGIHLDLYRHGRGGEFLAWLWILDDGFCVALDDLPALVGFLQEVLPLVRENAALEELEERFSERSRQRQREWAAAGRRAKGRT